MLFRTKDVLAYDAPSSNLHKFDSNEVLLKTANEMVDMQKMAFVQSKEFNPESLTTDSVLKQCWNQTNLSSVSDLMTG